jgi:hypothetical protein
LAAILQFLVKAVKSFPAEIQNREIDLWFQSKNLLTDFARFPTLILIAITSINFSPNIRLTLTRFRDFSFGAKNLTRAI